MLYYVIIIWVPIRTTQQLGNAREPKAACHKPTFTPTNNVLTYQNLDIQRIAVTGTAPPPKKKKKNRLVFIDIRTNLLRTRRLLQCFPSDLYYPAFEYRQLTKRCFALSDIRTDEKRTNRSKFSH